MSFKLSNIILDEIHKSTANQVEVVSGTATLDPSVPTTKLKATSSYTVYLPNGKIGQQKIITTIDGNSNVTINFNYGLRNGGPDTVTLYDAGDLVVFWANANGWVYQSHIYD
jgi:hypothetical protein